MINQFRDLTLLKTEPNQTLVMAAESSSSIGEKPGDQLQSPTEVTAKFAVRVCLLELLTQKAKPQAIFTLIGNEKEPTGRIMWQAIEKELETLPFEHNIILNGSTEDNMETNETSLGLVAVGTIDGAFESPAYQQTQMVVQVGEPYVGAAVLENLDTVPTYQDIYEWEAQPEVIDIIPVGANGSQADLEALFSKYALHLNRLETSWLKKSGGPSTSFVVALNTREIPAYLNERYAVEVLAVPHD